MKINSIIASTCMCVVALAGCVTVESTRAKLESNDPSQIKKAETDIYEKVTKRLDTDSENEAVEYVRLTSNHDLLLRIVDNAYRDRIRIVAAGRLDFTKDGVARSFIYNEDRYRILSIAEHSRARSGGRRTRANGYQEARAADYQEAYDNICRGICSNLTSAEMTDIIEKGVGGGWLRNLILEQLALKTDSPEVLCKFIMRESGYEVRNGAEFDMLQNKFLAMMEKNPDATLIQKLLESYHRNRLSSDARLQLMKMLPDETMAKILVSEINSSYTKPDLWNALKMGVDVLPHVRDEKAAIEILSAVLIRLDKEFYGEQCKEFIAGIPQLSDNVIKGVVCNDKVPWRTIIDRVTVECAYDILIKGAAPYNLLEAELVKKLPPEKINLELYKAVWSDKAKKMVMAALPAEEKASIQAKKDVAFAEVMGKAKEAGKITFAFDGFYLGMDLDDAKVALGHHFPDCEIIQDRDGEKDSDDYILKIKINEKFSRVCYASAKDRKVYMFNFNKAMLKKWYKYDAQTYGDWAKFYARETGADMRYVFIKDEVTNLFDGTTVYFRQDSYQYKNNAKEYRLIYFGEEKKAMNSALAGGLEGMLIEDAAKGTMRKVLGEPGTLRVQVDRD